VINDDYDNNNNNPQIEMSCKRLGKELTDTTNVEPEMYDYTSCNCGHWHSNEKLKENPGSCTRKTFDRFTTADSYTWTHQT
jgi:hypothetical protein